MALDFLMIAMRSKKRDYSEIYPKFIIKKSSDLMIKGGDFYAIWIEKLGIWSTDEDDALALIDAELDEYAREHCEGMDSVKVLHMWDSETGMIDKWHRYCQHQMRDSFHLLDESLVFSDGTNRTKKTDYASKTLPYSLTPGPITNYDRLMSVLYSPEERRKIEWAIGAIVSGDSKNIQKFLVFYGSAGTGKSTVLNIIEQLFDGYCAAFDAKSLASANNQFALEPFKNNPLVAIQHDGDLSRIEDNTRLNSLVSHETMTINEKFTRLYSARFNCFLFMGTNKPVKITDAKSGLLRRLIDVSPSGNKLSPSEYKAVTDGIKFELGAIACHCLKVYQTDPDYYNTYVPKNMLGASNSFYNFVEDSYLAFKRENMVTLRSAWEMYKNFCADAHVSYPYSRMVFKEELKNYFDDFKDRAHVDGVWVRNLYQGFKSEIFDGDKNGSDEEKEEPILYSIEFKEQPSIFDEVAREWTAQYASEEEGRPIRKWANVKTKLKDLDTSKLHYVMPPEGNNLIVIDFDITGTDGEKDFEKNLEAASRWPATYAEVSKSGKAIHLHYFYEGDSKELSSVYEDHVEIKKFNGGSSLRRKLTLCNDIPIATLNSGLPKKGVDKKVVNHDTIKSERGLRNMIIRNLNKEIHENTKPSVDFIFKILEDAYNSGLTYDVTDMRNDILAFAASSTNQGDLCLKIVADMKFKSDEPDYDDSEEEKNYVGPDTKTEDLEYMVGGKPDGLIFYDVEVFPNLFVVCYKKAGPIEENPVISMINPSRIDIENLIQYNLIGFNCRRYDNHILYGWLMGYTNESLYEQSKKIISGDNSGFFGEAYGLSYTDIYDFASAGNKKSLKKLEIEMGIHHQELGIPWDKPVDESLWQKVADYCKNDVIATEAAFNYLKADFTAREILSDLTGLTRNDTTNTCTTRLIFGRNKHPQKEFCYRDLSKPVDNLDPEVADFLVEACPDMMKGIFEPHLVDGVKPESSVLPYFPEYTFEGGKSIYREEAVGEGGYVYAEPGIHTNVALLDVASMHPHSIIAECLFGPKYTRIFRELVEARVSIKHEDWETVEGMLEGKLVPYIGKVKAGEMTSKELANALKTAINSVYGLTAANFDNALRDIRNKDNIVAKRGALFMVDLKHEVAKRGFTVAHIKTDSIKIPNADNEIIRFVMDFGKKYGYTFEHEATYEKMCLVNDAVYVAKYASSDWCQEKYGYLPDDNKKKGGKWTATGTQFQVPYVFKTLFSHEPIEFEDFCETKSVTSSIYLDMNEGLEQLSPEEEKELNAIDKAWHPKNPEQQDELIQKVCKRYKYDATDMGKRYSELCEKEEKGHSYHFVGRVGNFCPVLPGKGGGILVREKDGKYYAVTGTKGYRWLESEMVRAMYATGENKDAWKDIVDKLYYTRLVDAAADAITKYGDIEWFCS